MKYIIVWKNELENLERCVNDKIKKGYELQGGVSVGVGENGYICFFQAMILVDG